MPFRGVTFSGQNVTPKNDGGLYNAHYGDGVLWGCEMNISGDDLVIQSGEFIACGRVVQVDGATSVDLSGRTLQTGYIQVIMNADLSQGEGSQWYTTFVESATTTFPALTQGNINGTDTLYQLQLAVIQISGGNLTDITYSLVASNIVGNRNINLFGDETQVLLYDAGGNAFGAFGGFTSQPYLEVAKRITGGTRVSGLRLASSQANSGIWYGDGGNMVIRPNGASDSNGQWYISANGQMHNGTLVYSASVTSKNCPANANTEILRISNLSSITGKYMIFCYLTATMASTNTGGAYVNMYKNDSTKLGWDLKNWISRSGPSFMTGAIFCINPSNVVLKYEPSVQSTVTGTLDLIDIG